VITPLLLHRETTGRRPLAIDLFCNKWRMVIYEHYGYENRQGALGERAKTATEAWDLPAKAWRESAQARRYEIAGASVMAVNDDSMRLERSGACRLSLVSRPWNNGLRSVAGVCKFSCRHGAKTNTETFNRSSRFGRQL
jgi:hypothetical protein